MVVKLNREGVAVDAEYFWLPMSSCPLASKVQLLTTSGVAVYGPGNPNHLHYVAWAPLPKKPQWLLEAEDVLSKPPSEMHGY